MIGEPIRIDVFTAGITDHALDVVKANVMDRPELVGDFDAVSKCYGDYIKKIPKPRKIYEVKTRDNRGDDGHQGDGGGIRRGGRGGGSQTGRGGGGNNRDEKPSRKEVDDCNHIKDQYVSKTVHNNYSEAEKAKLYELRLDLLEKEGPQGNRKKYVCKIKSLQRKLNEAQMDNDDPSNHETDQYDSSHAYFEGGGLDTKDNKNLVRQGGPWKINKTNELKNETPKNENVGATPYASVAKVATVHTMLLQELVPTDTTRFITSMASKERASSYEMESHADMCVFGRGNLIVYDFNLSVNVQGHDLSLGLSEYSTVTGVHGYLHPRTRMTYHIVTHEGISIPHLEHHLLFTM